MRNDISLLCLIAILLAASACGAESPFVFRGTAGPLPFWFGTNLYGTAWTGFAPNDHSSDWWWYDKQHWRKTFEQCADAHLNTMVFWHPHPYAGFVHLEKFPEAEYLTPQETDRQIEMFRWITAEGKKHGVSIYFLTWNIWLPPGFCRKHGVDEFAADTPPVREYMRYAVRELFRTYPDLGGLITEAAEAPPGCTDFVLNSIIPGLKESVGDGSPRQTLPRLIFWTWCSYPEDAKRILDAYPGEKYALHYLQYEQYFKPMADPRILMTSKALGDVKVLALGGLGTSTGWLYWGDPFFVQKTMQDLVRKNGAGILFSGTDSFAFIAEKWIAREAFERYSWNPDAKDSDAYWEGRIAERYGNPDVAKQLLRAMIDSSNIVPRFMCLLHSQTDHYQPQCGLPLVNYLEMPTICTYVFENHTSIDARGRLTPNMGLTWPNPDWGEKVLSVKEYIKAKSSLGKDAVTTPDDIADEIEKRSRSSLDAVKTVRAKLDSVKERREELANTLKQMEMTSYLGLHCTEKIRAAVAWESWRIGSGNTPRSMILGRLGKSIRWWEKLSDVAWEVWPQPMDFWQSRVPVEPPWDHLDLWNGYRHVRFHFRDMVPILERERKLIAEQLRGDRSSARLPLFPDLDVPAGKIELLAAFDFEGRWPAELVASPGEADIVRVTDEPRQVVAGSRSLFCDTRASDQEWHLYAHTDPGKVKLSPGQKYLVEFDYRIVDAGSGDATPFAVAARTEIGGDSRDVGNHRFWGGRSGQVGHHTIVLDVQDHDDYYLFFSIHKKAAVVLDGIKISRILAQ